MTNDAPHRIPVTSDLQLVADSGLNPFALKLLAESANTKLAREVIGRCGGRIAVDLSSVLITIEVRPE